MIRKVQVVAILLFFFTASAAVRIADGAQTAGTTKPPANQASAVPPLPPDIPKDAMLWTVLSGGNPAGHQAVWTAEDGTRRVFLEYNDRGRGPKLTSVLTIAKNGTITALKIQGVRYLKDPVSESFGREGNMWHWSNPGENAAVAAEGPAFYLSFIGGSLNYISEELAQLVRAALAAGGTMKLLPEGEAHVERVSELRIPAPQATHIVLYAVSGLGFSPRYVWLDDEQQLFFIGDRYLSLVRTGHQGTADAVIAAQEKSTRGRYAELAKRLSHKPTKSLLIYAADLFDPESASVRRAQTVIVEGRRIVSVAPATSQDRARTDVEVIDGTGQMLLPGLWDMHVHISDANDGLMNIAAGVTSVRDLGNDFDELMKLRDRWNKGTEIGPRLMAAGIIEGPGPFQAPTKVLVDNEKDARAVVDRYAAAGSPQIKIYSSIKPELVPAIIDEAHRDGLRVSGHIPAGMTAEQCVGLGWDEIQHINYVVLSFFPEVTETRTPARFTVPAERAAVLDPASPRVQKMISLFKEKGTVIDPTLNVFEDMFTVRPGQPAPSLASVLPRLPAVVRRGAYGGGLPVPAGQDERYRDSFRAMERLVGALDKAGVTIVAGTDSSVMGFTLHHELMLYVESGIPAPRVLRIATLGAASLMKRDKELGTIAPGKLADMVLIAGDPSNAIGDLRHVRTVIKDGVVFKSADAYAALGVSPDK